MGKTILLTNVRRAVLLQTKISILPGKAVGSWLFGSKAAEYLAAINQNKNYNLDQFFFFFLFKLMNYFKMMICMNQ